MVGGAWLGRRAGGGRLAADDIASGALVRPFAGLAVELPNAYWIVRPLDAVKRIAVTGVTTWLKSQPSEIFVRARDSLA